MARRSRTPVVIPTVAPPPWQDRYLDTAGYRTRYWDEGSGTPVVFLHGIADHVAAFHPVLPKLKQFMRCLPLDLPGFGLTSRPAKITPEAYVGWLDEVLDGLGIERVVVLGHSLGGLMALIYATERPERVSALTLVSSAGLGRTVPPFLRLVGIPVIGKLIYRPTYKSTRQSYDLLVANPGVVPDEIAVWAWEHVSREGFATHMVDVLQMAGPLVLGLPRRFVFDDRLGELPQRLQVIWGERDGMFTVRHAERVREARPDADVVILPGVGHLPMLEAPEAFADSVIRFVGTLEDSRGEG